MRLRPHSFIALAENPRGRCGLHSHSFTCVCRGANPVDSSWFVGLGRLAAESRRMTSRGCLGQIPGQNRELFRNGGADE